MRSRGWARPSHAGKAGDLLGRLRMLERYDMKGLEALAIDAGISLMELTRLTLPALEIAGGLYQMSTDGVVTGDATGARRGRRDGNHHGRLARCSPLPR